MDKPFVWLNRLVFVANGNFIMSARRDFENFDFTADAIAGNPGYPVVGLTAIDPVRLIIHTTQGDYIQHGDPAWPRSAMRPVNPNMERYS